MSNFCITYTQTYIYITSLFRQLKFNKNLMAMEFCIFPFFSKLSIVLILLIYAKLITIIINTKG